MIITSHYPPSNLTGVHRARLFAKYLPQFGWNPIILTVDESFYEEKLDFHLKELIPKGQHIERVKAFSISKPRLVGDLGLRAFFHLKKKASEIIQANKIDFVFILIPSFYLSLLGPLLHRTHGVKYGIDYIDPWVHVFPGSEKIFSRHWFSTKLSKILEPIAVRRASLISSVSSSYIQPIFERIQDLTKSLRILSVPYGWDPEERLIIQEFKKETYLFKQSGKLKLIYSGAFLPKSEEVLRKFLFCIKKNLEFFEDVEIHFIGTDVSKSYPKRLSITEIASNFDLLGTVIFEHPERLSYFDLFSHIQASDGLFILGSTETHYTPSKLFNAFITEKPVFAILHPNSTARQIIEEAQWGVTSLYSNTSNEEFSSNVIKQFKDWKSKTISKTWDFKIDKAKKYTVQALTDKLASALSEID